MALNDWLDRDVLSRIANWFYRSWSYGAIRERVGNLVGIADWRTTGQLTRAGKQAFDAARTVQGDPDSIPLKAKDIPGQRPGVYRYQYVGLITWGKADSTEKRVKTLTYTTDRQQSFREIDAFARGAAPAQGVDLGRTTPPGKDDSPWEIESVDLYSVERVA